MTYRFKRVTNEQVMPHIPGTYRRVFEFWDPYMKRKGRPNTYWAETCCPGCSKVALLGSNHTVASGGIVTPSDVCPFPPCTFHEFIVLDDWDRPGPSHPPEGP